ncbi:hypothetical protein [Halomarina litorea]|uniref:hypothetical protein n=1 Tax=Halomarina litorea TaxID=2961595 RepID=UPI0020C4AD18|nr:hypothetical protein [Halomarina sp. BCD28]
MPLARDTEAWRTAAEASTYRDEVERYLREHPDGAFHDRELADALMGTGWADGNATDRDYADTMYLHDQLDELVRSGVVEARNVPTTRVDDPSIPDGTDYVTYFAHAGD